MREIYLRDALGGAGMGVLEATRVRDLRSGPRYDEPLRALVASVRKRPPASPGAARLVVDLSLCLLLADLWGCAPAPGHDSRPNIVIVLLDDMGYSDLGSYGSEIPTPHIDGLAAGGLRFTQFYNTGKCYPTRASLLTGLYWQRALEGKGLRDRTVTIAEALAPAGYATWMSGKWHLSPLRSDDPSLHPLARGFGGFFGANIGGSYYDPPGLQRDRAPLTPPDDFYFTDAIADEAAAAIPRSARSGRPFFVYVAFTAPHWPLQAPEATIARHAGAYDAGWDELRATRLKRQWELGVVSPEWRLSPRDPRVPAWAEAPDKQWQARRMAVYAAMLEHADRGVGKIVASLREEGVLDDTLILVLSDNGASHEEIQQSMGVFIQGGKDATRDGRPIQFGREPLAMPGPETTYQTYGREWAQVSNTPFREYKTWSHEGGIATPMIAHWPRRIRQRGAVTSAIGHVIDILPTCLDAAGVSLPDAIRGGPIRTPDGESLLPVLEGASLEPRTLFWEFANRGALRSGRWKIVTSALTTRTWELYDMESDRPETRDLARVHPERVEAMSGLFDAFAARVAAGDE